MAVTQEQADWFADAFAKLVDNVGLAILGKREQIALVLTALLSEGHVLLDDVAGSGKTVLAKAIAATIEGTSSRIQFTPDLLPTDILGLMIYNQSTTAFEFHAGPIFASVVLADEINRAGPKTLSALIEVMDEGVVTADGVARPVGTPFFVIATRNGAEQGGVYDLSESQLDRFMLRTSLGYPDRETMVGLLMSGESRARSSLVTPIITSESVLAMTALAADVHVDEAIMQYLADIVIQTRQDSDVSVGVSTRGALALARAVKTRAIASGRTFVIPADVRDLSVPVLGHRIVLEPAAAFAGVTGEQVVALAVTRVDEPTYRAS
ncbi:MAG: MoxR family ATPase [Actinomycetota bacterium]